MTEFTMEFAGAGLRVLSDGFCGNLDHMRTERDY